MERIKFKTVDGYLTTFPAETRLILQQLRNTIRQAAPHTEEVISYNMPAYKYHGVLVYFAGYKNHIGFYPTSSPIVAFKNKLEKYKTSKGAIQFPVEKGIPVKLVKEIVRFRLKEVMEKEKSKSKKKK